MEKHTDTRSYTDQESIHTETFVKPGPMTAPASNPETVATLTSKHAVPSKRRPRSATPQASAIVKLM